MEAASAQTSDNKNAFERVQYWTCQAWGFCRAKEVSLEHVGDIVFKLDGSLPVETIGVAVKVKSETPRVLSEVVGAISCPEFASPLKYEYIAKNGAPFSKASEQDIILDAKKIIPLQLVFSLNSAPISSLNDCDLLVAMRHQLHETSILTHIMGGTCKTEKSLLSCTTSPDRVTGIWMRVYNVHEDIDLAWDPRADRLIDLNENCGQQRTCVYQFDNPHGAQVIKVSYFCLRGNVFFDRDRNFVFEKNKVEVRLEC